MARMDLITEPRQYVHSGGLVAAICGTDGTADAVASFNGLGTELGRYPVNAAGNYLVQTNSATLGTVFALNLRGQYDVCFSINCVGAAGPVIVIGAISLNAAAAAMAGAVLNTSPGVKAIAQFSQIEAVTHALGPLFGNVMIDDTRAGSGVNAVRILLTDEAGATPPDADVVQASAYLCITRKSDLMGSFA